MLVKLEIMSMHAFRMLSIYGNEAIIMCNAPLTHETNAFHTDCLDLHFGANNKWHFYDMERSNRPLVNVTSKVVNKLLKEKSKLSFIASNK